MKRFGWRSSAGDDEQSSPPDNSPARSQRSSNSSSRGGSLKSANTAATKSREQSPARLGAESIGASTGGGGGGAVVAVSNKKMLKIGANVRFRGDVMECNTVVLCGRLQGFVETRRLTIKEGAQFVGDAKVEEADVSGSLEGSLESTAKVSIRSTGLVSGNVIYQKMSMEDGGELEGTFECSNRAAGRLRSKEGMAAAAAATAAAAGGGLNRTSAATDEAADSARPASVAGQEPQTRTPPRQQSPIHRHYDEQEDGVEKWSRAGNVVAERAGGGGGGGGGGGFGGSTGSVASSIGRWETTPSTAPAPAPSAAAAAGESESVFAYAGGSSGKVAARPPPSTAPSAAPASTTATSTTAPRASSEPGSIVKAALPSTAGGALRRIPPSGKSSSGDVSALPPPAAASAADTRASAPVRAPSPLRSGGLQVQSLGAEASEMFSAEAVTPTGPPSAELRGGGRTPLSAGTGAGAERGAAEVGGGTSVAARVVTWPPASPAPAGRVWQRRTENAVSTPSPSLAPAPYPTQTQTSSSPTVTPKTRTAKTLSETPETPPVAPSAQRPQQENQQQEQAGSSYGANGRSPSADAAIGGGGGGRGAGGVSGVAGGGAFVNGGGVGAGVGAPGGGDSGYESARDQEEEEDDEDAPPEISGPVKACEYGSCTLEACWGDPRFRPRYCARHKKQGNKLMDPVAAEEGDKEASPEGLSPPQEPLPSPAVEPPAVDIEPTGVSATASTAPLESPGAPPPFRMMAAVGLPAPSEPEVGNDDVLDGARGRGTAAAAAAAVEAEAVGGDETETDGLEDDEDEDEGWDSGGGAAVVGAVGGRLVEAPNGGSAMGRTGGGGGGGFGELPNKAELLGNGRGDAGDDNDDEDVDADDDDDDDYHANSMGHGAHGGDTAANAEAEDAGDVQARVAAYGRLSGKTSKVQVPSLPKPRAQKPKKRASGNNIADFYGGGESDEDDEETAFSMDAYSKGVLLSQAAEVGTHTEDGQLRPQASQERDQQKLAHLMRVGKLGGRISALRGKSVPTASGKRR